VTECGSILGLAWKELSEEDKKPYQEKADRDKERYKTAMESYVPLDDEDETPKKKKKAPAAKKVHRQPLQSASNGQKQDEDERVKGFKEMAMAMQLGPTFFKGLAELDLEEKVDEMRDRLNAKDAVFAGSFPKLKEIQAAKKVKEREKDLEGIDTSLILDSGSRRQRKSSVKLADPPPFAVHKDAQEEELEEEEEESEEESEEEDEELSEEAALEAELARMEQEGEVSSMPTSAAAFVPSFGGGELTATPVAAH